MRFHVGQLVRVTADGLPVVKGTEFVITEAHPLKDRDFGPNAYVGKGVPWGVWERYLEAVRTSSDSAPGGDRA